jgi:pyruvate-formate lyase-activating enzyme
MKLENIGFYTLSDNRAATVSSTSPLKRCELILTQACNFKCGYCRGIRPDYSKTLTLDEAKSVVDLWATEGLENVRFSGGEPLMWKGIYDLVEYTKSKPTIKHIAISSNGSAPFKCYERLVKLGVNDFSISLDACCAATGDAIAGVPLWQRVVDNIAAISKICYVTVGIVVAENNASEVADIVEYAHNLGVSDIRLISAAQQDGKVDLKVNPSFADKYPILKYRLQNFANGRNVRGLTPNDTKKCPLVLDDMAVVGDYHFPCIIYMREQGNPIGKIGANMRNERQAWFAATNTHCDPICSKNCLDVCIDYNNRVMETNPGVK